MWTVRGFSGPLPPGPGPLPRCEPVDNALLPLKKGPLTWLSLCSRMRLSFMFVLAAVLITLIYMTRRDRKEPKRHDLGTLVSFYFHFIFRFFTFR